MSNTRAPGAAVLGSAVLVLAGVGLFATGAPASAGAPAPALLPDVVVRPITDVRIEKSTGVKLLRFATTVGNRGAGPIELLPNAPDADTDDCDGDGDPENDRRASQIVYGDTNANDVFDRDVDEEVDRRPAGCSVFHVEHDHWHLEEFATYRLVKPATGRVKATSEKVSFCLRDSMKFATLDGTPRFVHYGDCGQDSVMGLSIGWADLYSSGLAGQELDVRGLPDGRYCLRIRADPADRLAERIEKNNARSTLLRILGSEVTDLRRGC
jgi:hypothetical protein